VAGHFLSRQERFAVVGSTNDVVRGWLAEGTPEVALAVADEQAQGRGREGRTWTAPTGKALLLSLGFRPSWLAPDQAWRIAATASVAMAEAAEALTDLPNGTIRLKWPNDLVVESSGEWRAGASPSTSEGFLSPADTGWLKLGGVLGETEGLGTADPRVVVGMGINADWARAEFPADIAAAMTSLREASGGHRTTPDDLLSAFLPRLETEIEDLRATQFLAGEWQARQATTGRRIRLELPNGPAEEVVATGVDPTTGALVLEDGRRVLSAEVRHVRAAPLAARV
jgi:BirA family transcriptional regulator, biotin operon repressor / biotin---[acetyl-CoA-carboxylase] ligase